MSKRLTPERRALLDRVHSSTSTTEHERQVIDTLDAWLAPAELFLYERYRGASAEQIEEVAHRAMVELLRSDVPLDRITRDKIASVIEQLRWPAEHKEKLKRERADWDRYHINSMAEALKAKGVRAAKKKAREELARIQNVQPDTILKRRQDRRKKGRDISG
jgi:hypothetical protein